MHTPQTIDANRLNRISQAVSRHVGPRKLAGATVLLARDGEIVHTESQGVLSQETGSPMKPDSIFRIYSMTKPIVSVAAMILHEQGAFQLYDPLSRYVPAAANLKVLDEQGNLVEPARAITIRDLLSHTSGFSYWGGEEKVDALYREAGLAGPLPLDEFVSRLLRIPLAGHPGSKWRYSVSMDVLAHVVELVSGRRLDEFLSERLFNPLGMADTGFHVPSAKHDRFAWMYGSADILDGDGTGLEQWREAESGNIRVLATASDCLESQPHNVMRGGHGLVSTAPDYLRFCRMMQGGGELDGNRILGKKAVELMTRNTLPSHLPPIELGGMPQHGLGWGLGFCVLMDAGLGGILGSDGTYSWGGAASTYFWIDPREQLIGIQMAQFQPAGFHRIGDDFRTAVYQALV
ncbi:MAG: beta-lactamase family protein [Spirochaetaceae bacterium]|nr:beta-lactamase family protein [Spirochaetaceae bacterium]